MRNMLLSWNFQESNASCHFTHKYNRFKEADKVFKKGIEQQAQPLERLNRKYHQFLERIAEYPSAAESPVKIKPKLFNASVMDSSLKQEIVKPKAKMEVYQPKSTEPAEKETLNCQWDEPPTSNTATKENVIPTESWAGVTVPQNVKSKKPEGIYVFKDPDNRFNELPKYATGRSLCRFILASIRKEGNSML
jgi:hypothetical protein